MQAYSAGHFSPLLSAIFVYGLINIPLLYLLVVSVQRLVANIRLARRARETERQVRGELHAGPIVVKGRVRRLPGHDVAVRVEIDQLGEETHSRNGTKHTWTEKQRRNTINPFDIELGNGTMLRCEPDAKLELVDKMEEERRHRRDYRTLAAELTPDEFVWAVGSLYERIGKPPQDASATNRGSGPYRAMPSVDYVLKNPPGGRLLVASERLEKRFRRRIGFHLRWVVWALGLFVLAQALCYGYHLRRKKGVVVTATVTSKRYVRAGKSTHHYVYVRLPNERPSGIHQRLREDASRATFRDAHRGQKLPMLIVPWKRWTAQFGDKPTVNLVLVIALLIGGLAIAVVHYQLRERTKDWHERELVNHSGKGALDQSYLS